MTNISSYIGGDNAGVKIGSGYVTINGDINGGSEIDVQIIPLMKMERFGHINGIG